MGKVIQVKTSELTGAALDWAVAVAVGHTITGDSVQDGFILVGAGCDGDLQREFAPSTDWAQGGPLIDEYIGAASGPTNARSYSIACFKGSVLSHRGQTILIATCRAVVACKLGDVVEVPAELVEVAE